MARSPMGPPPKNPQARSRVVLLRHTRVWSQSDLARLAGVNKETISIFEQGGTVHERTLEKIAEACGLTISALFAPLEL
jgi:transcriptional regulator with XRE-family HTH domain